jgi:hypothetical protein
MEDIQWFIELIRRATGDGIPSTMTVGLMVLVVLGCIWTFLIRKHPFKKSLIWIFSPFFITFLILLIGTIFRERDTLVAYRKWTLDIVWVVLFTHIPVAGILMYYFRKYIVLVLVCSVFITWVSLHAVMMSCFSISGWP